MAQPKLLRVYIRWTHITKPVTAQMVCEKTFPWTRQMEIEEMLHCTVNYEEGWSSDSSWTFQLLWATGLTFWLPLGSSSCALPGGAIKPYGLPGTAPFLLQWLPKLKEILSPRSKYKVKCCNLYKKEQVILHLPPFKRSDHGFVPPTSTWVVFSPPEKLFIFLHLGRVLHWL